MQCPLCQNDTIEVLQSPYWQEQALVLAKKVNPDWREEDGCCVNCFVQITEAAASPVTQETPFRARGVASGYRYVLSERETAQWNHCNADLQRWWQNKIVDRISGDAIASGFDEWFIFNAEEKPLGQGMSMVD